MEKTIQEYKDKIKAYFTDNRPSDYYRYSEYIHNVKFLEIPTEFFEFAYNHEWPIDKFLRNVFRNIHRNLYEFSDIEILEEVEHRCLEDRILENADTGDLVDTLDWRGYFDEHNEVYEASDRIILDVVKERNLIPTSFAEFIGANNAFSYTKDELKTLAINYIDKNF